MDIYTTIAAWVGAIGTSVLTLFEIYKHLSNKAKLKITVSHGLEIIGSTKQGKMVNLHPDKTFWTVYVVNTGNKKVTITQMSINRNDTDVISMLTEDFHGRIKTYTLKPGSKGHDYTIPEGLIPYKNVDSVVLMDSTQKVYKKSIHHTRQKIRDFFYRKRSWRN